MNRDIVDSLTGGPRRTGQTTSNIGLLLVNPKAKMVVHNYNMKRLLSRQYNLDESRFFTIEDLNNDKHRGTDGPLFFDATAVTEMVTRAYERGRNTPNTYNEAIDFMKSAMEYSKKHNISITFTPL